MFNLITEHHPRPYQVRSFGGFSTFVRYRCLVPINFGIIQLYAWCDVLPLKGDYHIHLGDLWLGDVNGFYRKKNDDYILEYQSKKLRIPRSKPKTLEAANHPTSLESKQVLASEPPPPSHSLPQLELSTTTPGREPIDDLIQATPILSIELQLDIPKLKCGDFTIKDLSKCEDEPKAISFAQPQNEPCLGQTLKFEEINHIEPTLPSILGPIPMGSLENKLESSVSTQEPMVESQDILIPSLESPLDLPQPKSRDLTIEHLLDCHHEPNIIGLTQPYLLTTIDLTLLDDHKPCLDPPLTTLELGGLDRTDSMEHLGPTLPFELDLDPRPQPLDLEKLFQDPMILESCLLGPATHTLEPPLGPATHEKTKIELNNALLYPPEIEDIDFIGICFSPTHTTLHENGLFISYPLHIKSKKSINLYLLPLACEAYSSGLTFAYHIFKSYITSTHEKTTTFKEGHLLIFRKGGLPPEMLKTFKSNSPEENFLPPGKSDAGAWSPIKLPVKHGPPNPWRAEVRVWITIKEEPPDPKIIAKGQFFREEFSATRES